MPEAVLLAAACACNLLGMGWLALSLDVHWAQVRGGALRGGAVRALRVAGGLGLAAALALCLSVNHATIAVLVWFMSLAASALIVAFALSWRPVLLRPLTALWRGGAARA